MTESNENWSNSQIIEQRDGTVIHIQFENTSRGDRYLTVIGSMRSVEREYNIIKQIYPFTEYDTVCSVPRELSPGLWIGHVQHHMQDWTYLP